MDARAAGPWEWSADMGLLDWMKKDAQVSATSPEKEQQPRFKQPGAPFQKGDRVVVYETWHLGRELKPDPHYAPGIVSSVHHNGTLVSYERGGRLPANAAVEDVRHATEAEAHKYANEFSAIEANIERQQRPLDNTERGRKTVRRPGPSWER
jgi:hypothetical protein